MQLKRISYLICLFSVLYCSCKKQSQPAPAGTLQLSSVKIGAITLNLSAGATNPDIPIGQPIMLSFSSAIDTSTNSASIILNNSGAPLTLHFSYLDNYKTIAAQPFPVLQNNNIYMLQIPSSLRGAQGETLGGLSVLFTTIPGTLKILSIPVGDQNLFTSSRVSDVARTFPAIIKFDHP